MSLQTRLFAFFIAIVVLPLGAATLLGQRVIVRELEQRTFAQLIPARRAAIAVYNQKAIGARDRVQLVASAEEFKQHLVNERYQELSDFLASRLGQGALEVDYITVASPEGAILASAMSQPRFLPGVEPPTAEEIVKGVTDESGARRFLVTRAIVPIRSEGEERDIAVVVGGYYLDNEFMSALSADTGVEASLFLEESAVSSTIPAASTAESEGRRIDLSSAQDRVFLRTELADQAVYASPGQLADQVPITVAALVMTASQAPVRNLIGEINTGLVILLLLAAIGAAVLGFWLARVISRPLQELAAGADAIAAGNYDTSIRVRSKDEMGQLAIAFTQMAQRLKVHIAELKDSKEELKRALTRFAETLRSTHDRERMLELVLEVAMDTLGAERGLLMWMTPSRDSLVMTLARGMELPDLELGVGEGIAGTVAATGDPLRLPDGDEAPQPSDKEPRFASALSVPIFSEHRVIAVLNLYDKEGGIDFTEADMGTLLSLADQAGVAIENVLLHEATRRQAITDGLTGLWNYRYFTIRYEEEIDRSARFMRPFSLIVLDIDHFKQVNDTYGHQRGDSVLIELARRIKREIRDIDVLARYGGEEFVLILPETDPDGGLRTAEKIREVVSSETFVGDPDLDVTISLGLACFPDHGTDGQSLLRNADKAMYAAKESGRNKVVLYGGREAA